MGCGIEGKGAVCGVYVWVYAWGGLGYYMSAFSLATPHSVQKPVTKGFLPSASSNQFWTSSAP